MTESTTEINNLQEGKVYFDSRPPRFQSVSLGPGCFGPVAEASAGGLFTGLRLGGGERKRCIL